MPAAIVEIQPRPDGLFNTQVQLERNLALRLGFQTEDSARSWGTTMAKKVEKQYKEVMKYCAPRDKYLFH